jgi:hypothetical protein
VCWPFGSVTVTLANVPAGKSVIVTRSAVGVATVTVALPALLIAPILVGLTDQVTDVLKLPVPVTVGVQDEVCVVRMEAGEQATDTEVIVGWAVTVTGAEPDFVESSVDVAVIVAVPAAEGVNTPPDEIVPSVAAHVTAEL